jgi:Xaa-Pro aminopeptidase
MLTAEGCRARRQRLWDRLSDRPDWILIADPEFQMYLANYHHSQFVFRTTNAGTFLILGADGSCVLIADNFLTGYASQAFVDEVVAPVWYRGKESAPHREAMLVATLLDRLKKCPGKHIGLEMSRLPTGVIEGLRAERGDLKLTNVDPILHELKRVKDPDEVALIRHSLKAIAAGQAAAMAEIRPGMTEFDAFLLVQKASLLGIEEQCPIYGDFVSGPRCEAGGGPPSDRVIEKGDLFILDFSVVVRGYRGDVCNTFRVGETPTDEQFRLYHACIDAITAAEKAVRAGVAAKDIDRTVRDSFASKHLAETFTTHTGHGIGLGHPDAPYLTPDSSDTLMAGDVIAIEPGQYHKGLAGMRFERNYLVTETGFEVLSTHKLQIDASA